MIPEKLHCELCLSPIAEGRAKRWIQGHAYDFCCPGCAQVFEILGPDEARRQGPSFKGGKDAAELPPGPYLELWLGVEGIQCGACGPLIEGLLQSKHGVVKAVVEPVSETAQVLYAPGWVSKEDVAKHCASYGFPARELKPHELGEDERHSIHEALRLVLAIVLGANAMMNAMVIYAAFARDRGIDWFADLIFEQRIYDRDPMPLLVRDTFTWATGLTALPVLLYCGWPIILGGWRRIRLGSPNTDSLVGFGALAAFVVSLYAGVFLHSHHVYFDTASMLVSLLVIGRAIEGGAKRKAQRAVSGLLRLTGNTSERLEDGQWREVALDSVVVGDRLRVKLGERIPVDGRVLAGEGWVDASSLTGEPLPVAVDAGSAVMAGTLLTTGTLEIEAQAVGHDTRLSRIVDRVRQTFANKPPIQLQADRLAALFMPVIIALAVFSGFLAYAKGIPPTAALMAGVSVLVVACPCALGLATPLVLVSAVAECAKRGLLLKGGEVLEQGPRIKAVVFDKTGTLTTGELDFTGSRSEGMDLENSLYLATALEEVSSHPIAERIFREGASRAQEKGVPLPIVTDRRVHPGLGVSGTWNGMTVRVGRPLWLRSEGVGAPDAWWSGAGLEGSLVMLAVQGRAVALWGLGDSIRPEAPQAVRALETMGIQCWLVSGDRREACAPVAAKVGIPESRIVGGALPDEKGEQLTQIQSRVGPTAMVGDGVNDAVALSQADLGIAMGSGAGVSLESAGLVLVHRDLRRIPVFFRLSRKAVRRLRQNLGWALVYNAVLVPLALTGHVHPVLAAGAMMASSVSVVLNGGRALKLQGAKRSLETD